MGDDWKQFGRRALTGEDHSWPARLARAATAAVEPAYATVMRVRNRLYDAGVKRSHDLGRSAVSVGNLTTGGTGKTPVVAWLAERLRAAGHRPAVLLRGYGAGPGQSDEAAVYRRLLGDGVPVEPDPSRVAGAATVLRAHPATDVFLLDDAFQHRRAARAFDLVLVSATDPWGGGHVLPRGLLREPVAGLRRADAVVLTRCDLATEAELATIEGAVRRVHPAVPIGRADAVHAGVRWPATGVRGSIADVGRFHAVAGIGDPAALDRQLRAHGDQYVGHRWFADHHRYTPADAAAALAGDAAVLTTEKDWAKLADVVTGDAAGRFAVLELAVRFHGDGGERLLQQIGDRLGWAR